MKNPFPSKDFYQFVDSMKPDIAQYYEHIGYDLEVLKRLSESELEEIVKVICAQKGLDWRDIEALDAIGSESAIAALTARLKSRSISTRLDVAERLYARNIISLSALEEIILAAIRTGTDFRGFSSTLYMARNFPTLVIKHRLLWSIVFGKEERGNVAKHVYIIYGIQSPSDLSANVYNYRKFDSKFLLIRLLSFLDFCERIKVNPWMALIKGA